MSWLLNGTGTSLTPPETLQKRLLPATQKPVYSKRHRWEENPVSDQHPVYSPPPDYTPEPPAAAYGGDAFGAPPPVAAPPQKRKPTALIIGIVVGSLLLCCCIGGAGAALFLLPGETSTSSDSGIEADVFDVENDPRLQEWLEWAPESPPMMQAAPAEKEPLIAEALSITAPEFSFEEAVWSEGEYVVAEDWYYADGFFIRAMHPSSDQISAAVELWLQSDLMLVEGIPFETAEGDILSSISDRQLVYRPQWGEGFFLTGEEETALWELLGEQWPGGVITDAVGDSTTGITASITKWEAYAVDAGYPIVSASYAYENGEWVLEEWEYVYPEDEGTPTT